MVKGVTFPLQSSRVKARDLDPVGQIPPFLGNHWLLVPGSCGSPQHCSHFDSFMPHHPVTSSVLDSGDRQPAGSCLSMQCSLAWDPNQTPRKKVSRTLLEARRVGHQFPEGSNSFNAGWPREGLLRDRKIHLELFCMCLCLDMSQIIREKCGHRI